MTEIALVQSLTLEIAKRVALPPVSGGLLGLYQHWFRAALSMLGISWGIISVVVLLAYGNGFRAALDAGFRGAFSDGTVVVVARPDEPAGGRRARRQTRARHRRRRDGDRRAAAREERQPRVHAGVPGRLRQQAVEPSRARRGGVLRHHAREKAAGRRPVPRRRGRAAAAARRLHRHRGAAQAVRRHPAGRRDDPRRRPAVRDRRRDGREGPALELQPARQVLRLHSVDDDGRAVGQPLRRHVRVAGGVADARAEGDACRSASSSRSAIATTRPTSAP